MLRRTLDLTFNVRDGLGLAIDLGHKEIGSEIADGRCHDGV